MSLVSGYWRRGAGLALVFVFALGSSLAGGAASLANGATCPNDAFRIGYSAGLPDCRSYERVSPAETNGEGASVSGRIGNLTGTFPFDLVAASGDNVAFTGISPSLPAEGNPQIYEVVRGPDGWVSHNNSLGAGERIGPVSPDHAYWLFGRTKYAWNANREWAPIGFGGGGGETLVRTPSGDVEPLGLGSLGHDPYAFARLITPGATHVIFESTPNDAEQRVSVPNYTTGGTFTLRLGSEGTSTPPIPYNAGKNEVRVALEASSAIGVGNVSVEEGGKPHSAHGWIVRFIGMLAHTPLPPLVGDSSGLTVSGGEKAVVIDPVGGVNDDFSAGVSHLELQAPEATGATAIYDRTEDGLDVVSLLPGDVTPESAAQFQGVARDGTAVAFKVGPTLYVRVGGTTTEAVIEDNGVHVGTALTCTGGPGTATLAYQWLRNGAEIAGATSSTYMTTAADEGEAIQCRVAASSAEGASRGTSATVITVEPFGPTAPPSQAQLPSISGTATVGKTLTCGKGNFWSGDPSFAYQWLRNGTPIVGANAETYAVVGADNETAVQCEIIATNSAGTSLADSPRTVIRSEPPVNTGTVATAPGVTGTPVAGETLSCSTGVWTGAPSFAYQWLRSGLEIPTATSSTYVLVAADEGKAIQCRVTATNTGGSGEATSANAVVAPAPTPLPPTRPVSALAVTGLRNVGQALTCSHGTWGNAPGEFEYQWLRNGVPIGGAASGATAAASFPYTTVSADLDKLLQCRVVAINAGGSSAVTSPATQANVITANPPSATSSVPGVAIVFAGVSQDGDRVFYLQNGDVYSFDTSSQALTRATSTGDVQLTNISADGSHVYFLSGQQLGGNGTAGQPNLYAWDAGTETTAFIATVTGNDVSEGLSKWTEVVGPIANVAADPSESTPDGEVFIFEATAKLTAYENSGHSEIYRYDPSGAPFLLCVSCNPSGDPPVTGSHLRRYESPFGGVTESRILDRSALAHNLSEDGNRVFYQTSEALVPGDVDNAQDVYQWEAPGTGGCMEESAAFSDQDGGCVALISSGQSASAHQPPLFGDREEPVNFFFGATPDGDDVVFVTRDALVPGASKGDEALYDARVGGGFPQPAPTVCSGEACQGQPGAPPSMAPAVSTAFEGPGNRKVRRHRHRAQHRHKHRRKQGHKHRRKQHRKGRAGR